MPDTPRRFAVLGAGIVGVCCALALRRDGHEVTLIDRDPPGTGCSYGNAGLIQVEAAVPIATPGILWRVPGMLLDPLGPLAIRWRYLPRLAPYLVHFLAASRRARVEAISAALAEILNRAGPAWSALIDEAGAGALVRHRGELHVYFSEAAYAAAEPMIALRRRRGMAVETFDGAEARRREPAVSPEIRRAYFLPDVRHTIDPLALTGRLVERYRGIGGAVRRAAIAGFDIGADGLRAVLTDAGRHETDAVVVCLGAYSKPFAKRLGARVPLDTERGYHMMLPAPGIALETPVLSGDHRFAATPMAGGLRLAGTAELAGLEAPPDPRRAEILLTLAKRMLPGLQTSGAEPWMGRRPATPDSLPVIARAPRFANAFLAFGHGHLGLTMAAVTGRLIADLAADRAPEIDLAPFRADRF